MEGLVAKGRASSVEPLLPARRRKETGPPSARLAELQARGRQARSTTPLADHAIFDPTSLRPDPVELLARQGRSRVEELLPIRYGRMVSSPFAFYRGGALVMAADLASTPSSGLRVQLCGDAHLSNFGMYATPERNLVFDLNDFDETLPGPFEWDVKRLAASLEIVCRVNSFRRAETHHRRGDGARLQEGHASFRRDAEPGGLVCPAWSETDPCGASREDDASAVACCRGPVGEGADA